jgi:hypothetical protein
MTRVRGAIPPPLQEAAGARGLAIGAALPENEEIRELDAEGKPLVGVGRENPVLRGVGEILQRTGLLAKT